MSEDDIGEVRDELKEYKRQLDAVRKDLEFLIKHSQMAKNSIINYSNQTGNPHFDPFEIERCKAFIAKYGIRVG